MLGWVITIITALIGPLVSFTIRALGVGIVSYIGFDILVETIEYYIWQNYGQFPDTVIQLLNLAGLDSAIKILLSTLSACAAFRAMTRAAGIAWKKPGSPTVLNA